MRETRVPADEQELIELLKDPMWRIRSGFLYKVKNKQKKIVPFIPNEAQEQLLQEMHWRNVIPKARQRGFSTLIQLLGLDTALFQPGADVGVIAQDLDTAYEIFGDKFKLAYDNLPAMIKGMVKVVSETKSSMKFDNGSGVRVGTSMRGGTPNFVHVSEFGKICAKTPDKAREVLTGTLPAVPVDGIIFIESTAEGRDGAFYAMVTEARALQDQGRNLSPLEFKLHFASWWDADEYELDPDGVAISPSDHEYFAQVEAKIGRPLSANKRAWYVTHRRQTFAGDKQMMYQEFPSCVSGNTWVSTPSGIVRMRDVEVDGQVIVNKFDQGVKPVFKVQTLSGYTVVCTEDHPILCIDGEYRELKDLSSGDIVTLAAPQLGSDIQQVEYQPNLFTQAQIKITEEFALFLGFFMGDGSFYKNCVSIACDGGDLDVVEEVERLMNMLCGGANSRIVGSKQGCIEVRRSDIVLAEPFYAMNIIRQNCGGIGAFKRNVHVPDFIMRSPREVVRQFLRGLFEADGFAQRSGNGVKFFSKYEHFAKDVQLLLLAFGITSRVKMQVKKSGAGGEYEGWELSMRTNEAIQFAQNIGFVSARKQERAMLKATKKVDVRSKSIVLHDAIASITPAGDEHVYDITTVTHNFNAGGIVVHNCLDEAFSISMEGTYYAVQLAAARNNGQFKANIPVLQNVPTYTFWDIGNSDGTAIWVMQKLGMEWRVIKFKEGWGEPYSTFAKWLQGLGLMWGTMFLPHDADHVRQGQTSNKSPKEMLEELMPGVRFEIVPRIADINWGIQQTRDVFPMLYFDESECKEGIIHIESYRRKWNERQACWSSDPDKTGGHSEAADALRQFAQAYTAKLINMNSGGAWKRKPTSWKAS